MNLERAQQLMPANLVAPEFFIDCLQAVLSEEERIKLNQIPCLESDLSARDIYAKDDKGKKIDIAVKNTHILFPMLTAVLDGQKIVPSNTFHLIRRFGYAPNQLRKLFFNNNTASAEGGVPGWKDWFFNEKVAEDHPIYRPARLSWLLMRKNPIPDSLGKNLKDGSFYLRGQDRVPTLLEVLIGMVGFYFLTIDSKRTDQEVGMPIFESREWFARLLNGKMAWTSDKIFIKQNTSGENLTVGLNTPASGIYISKLNETRPSEITGVTPVRELNWN